MVIVYESKTGFTRKYAEMLAAKTGFAIFPTKDISKVSHKEEIIFLGWLKVGKVQGLNKLSKHQVKAVCGSGTGRTAEPDTETVIARNDIKGIPFFYLRGIGLAMAIEFLKAGCRVTLSGRGEALSDTTKFTLKSFEGKYIYIPCNVQKKESLQNLWDASLAKWSKIDIWINNAGQSARYTAWRAFNGTGVIAGRLYPSMMLTDFITKAPNGKQSKTISEDRFKKIFNILSDKPETVAKFFIPQMLNNVKNDIRIAWLTNGKITWRFMTAGFRKDRLIK